MITNDKQYKVTKEQVEKFQREIDNFNAQEKAGVNPILIRSEESALESQKQTLLQEIQDYENKRR